MAGARVSSVLQPTRRQTSFLAVTYRGSRARTNGMRWKNGVGFCRTASPFSVTYVYSAFRGREPNAHMAHTSRAVRRRTENTRQSDVPIKEFFGASGYQVRGIQKQTAPFPTGVGPSGINSPADAAGRTRTVRVGRQRENPVCCADGLNFDRLSGRPAASLQLPSQESTTAR